MWYYANNGAQSGPVQESEIIQLLANGTLNAGTLVWRDGLADWQPLGQTELSRLLAPAVGTPAAAVATNPYQPPQAGMADPGAVPGGPAERLTWAQVFWSFSGRIPRRTYWAASLIWVGIFLAVGFIGGMVGALVENEDFMMIPIIIAMIPYIWSSIAIQVKRWHDRGKSGAMVLVNLIPYVGGIWTFIECGCLRGSEGWNQYGGDPT